ncbi:MAG: YneF family protein [Liquorilactobacillus nagelii]|jgi:uncharacterized protein YneF (UPF0154 family)|uniref:UPF0154 protein BSQ50_06660 n=1 Tax=Liquorilactobacillus nagelii TaxID=82688 RepID=A0A3S6R158_9LACO|nr:YneF family protein [Liquorilactobacillus nagelii]AUJ32267.1 hypothetical protein BSQ50_06660 [Liquorilactobacillus nagelii]KRL40821.1 hypothetical protein FD45_GL001471 [Liquorilactobacillus nagelii DSM 13675]MCC7615442.1 hypothetical protein [Liquorilactobacillus nagelii]MCI1632410.1 YneF family protein [Liquorilactobacillus nagelii]MCI1699510.1 YneF family protein [Liquorilactobacillus nagelii]
MSTAVWILLIVLALVLGFVGGFFAARKYMENYLKKNPPINENMLKMMMLQMGQKPSERKLHQMMNAMKTQSAKQDSKK